ncbi:AraC family transcriptional regulator [Paenibacillus oryzisoli]|uniref:helix-turn-helix domain-containing protein n=1 Tax=Paenibacillus oryzisoli TaxID=1850517 RepID=UPI003D2B73AB
MKGKTSPSIIGIILSHRQPTFLQEAKWQLLNSALSIESLASLLGYQDTTHFSRQFKRWSGLTPSEFRRGT